MSNIFTSDMGVTEAQNLAVSLINETNQPNGDISPGTMVLIMSDSQWVNKNPLILDDDIQVVDPGAMQLYRTIANICINTDITISVSIGTIVCSTGNDYIVVPIVSPFNTEWRSLGQNAKVVAREDIYVPTDNSTAARWVSLSNIYDAERRTICGMGLSNSVIHQHPWIYNSVVSSLIALMAFIPTYDTEYINTQIAAHKDPSLDRRKLNTLTSPNYGVETLCDNEVAGDIAVGDNITISRAYHNHMVRSGYSLYRILRSPYGDLLDEYKYLSHIEAERLINGHSNPYVSGETPDIG